jgi:polysaccharide export outer membrane protein
MLDRSIIKPKRLPLTSLALSSLLAIALSPDLTKAQLPLPEQPASLESGRDSLNSDYRLGPGDTINIYIPELNNPPTLGDYLVPVDGLIYLPLIGSISVAGRTVDELGQILTEQYLRFFKYPQVVVRLVKTRGLNIVVIGEVNNPGSHTIAEDNRFASQVPSVTQALQVAGGVNLSADLRRVQVRRVQGGGREQLIELDLWKFLQNGDRQQNITLLDGDTIFVPATTEVSLPQARRLATVSFAPDPTTPRTVAVLGAVTTPGSYVVKGGDTQLDRLSEGLPTVTRAIQLAGGASSSADMRRIQIRRATKSSGEQIFYVDLWEFLQEGDLDQNTVLQDGDTIFIPTLAQVNLLEARQLASSNFAADPRTPRTVTVIGEVLRPGPYVVKGGNTEVERVSEGLPTLTRAIQLAEGITDRADIRRVQIRRPNVAGAEQIFYANLWQLLQTGDINQDPIIEDGDIIVVPTATAVNPAEAVEISSASFSPDRIRVYLVGEEVDPPGVRPSPEVQLPPNTPLNQALLSAGAFNRVRANKNSIDLIRLNLDGTVTKRTVTIDLTAGINEETNPLLRNNDIIVVNRSGLARVRDAFDEVGNFLFFAPRANELLNLFQRLGIF